MCYIQRERKMRYSNTEMDVNVRKAHISVKGVGYVGLCTAVGFASKGYHVISSDIDVGKEAKI